MGFKEFFSFGKKEEVSARRSADSILTDRKENLYTREKLMNSVEESAQKVIEELDVQNSTRVLMDDAYQRDLAQRRSNFEQQSSDLAKEMGIEPDGKGGFKSAVDESSEKAA